MKLAAIMAFLFAMLLIAVAPMASTVYYEAYPQDPAKKEALRQCVEADSTFNRLIAAARFTCYNNHPNAGPSRHSPPLPPTASRLS